MSTARKKATYEDVLNAPPNVVAEILRGALVTHPRPRIAHAGASSVLGAELGPPFGRGRGGPGGWVILDEPEIHLGEDVLVPDLGGWKRGRFGDPGDAAFLTLAPDWVCEVLSPSTNAVDRTVKLPIYAREQVSHAWLIDPAARTLEALRLDGDTWRIVGSWADEALVKAEPFEAVVLELGLLWRY